MWTPAITKSSKSKCCHETDRTRKR